MADVTISQLSNLAPSNSAILPFSQGNTTYGTPLSSLFANTTLIKTTSVGRSESVQLGTSNPINKKFYFIQKTLQGTGVNGTYNLGDWINIGEISATGSGWGKQIKIYETHHVSDSVNSVEYVLNDVYYYNSSAYTGWTAIPSTSNYNYGAKRDFALEAQLINPLNYSGLRFRYRRLEGNTIPQATGTVYLIIEVTGGEFTETTGNGNDPVITDGFLGNTFYQFPVRNYEGGWAGFSPSTKGLFINSNGRLGVNTTSPRTTLEINGGISVGGTESGYLFNRPLNTSANIKDAAANIGTVAFELSAFTGVWTDVATTSWGGLGVIGFSSDNNTYNIQGVQIIAHSYGASNTHARAPLYSEAFVNTGWPSGWNIQWRSQNYKLQIYHTGPAGVPLRVWGTFTGV